jgi:hypothetical protein
VATQDYPAGFKAYNVQSVYRDARVGISRVQGCKGDADKGSICEAKTTRGREAAKGVANGLIKMDTEGCMNAR